MADFVAEIGDQNSEAADAIFLRRTLWYAPLGAGFDAVVLTPAAVTQRTRQLMWVLCPCRAMRGGTPAVEGVPRSIAHAVIAEPNTKEFCGKKRSFCGRLPCQLRSISE
jgi:hypothetical protein